MTVAEQRESIRSMIQGAPQLDGEALNALWKLSYQIDELNGLENFVHDVTLAKGSTEGIHLVRLAMNAAIDQDLLEMIHQEHSTKGLNFYINASSLRTSPDLASGANTAIFPKGMYSPRKAAGANVLTTALKEAEVCLHKALMGFGSYDDRAASIAASGSGIRNGYRDNTTDHYELMVNHSVSVSLTDQSAGTQFCISRSVDLNAYSTGAHEPSRSAKNVLNLTTPSGIAKASQYSTLRLPRGLASATLSSPNAEYDVIGNGHDIFSTNTHMQTNSDSRNNLSVLIMNLAGDATAVATAVAGATAGNSAAIVAANDHKFISGNGWVSVIKYDATSALDQPAEDFGTPAGTTSQTTAERGVLETRLGGDNFISVDDPGVMLKFLLSNKDDANLGYTAKEMTDLGYSVPQMIAAGIEVDYSSLAVGKTPSEVATLFDWTLDTGTTGAEFYKRPNDSVVSAVDVFKQFKQTGISISSIIDNGTTSDAYKVLKSVGSEAGDGVAAALEVYAEGVTRIEQFTQWDTAVTLAAIRANAQSDNAANTGPFARLFDVLQRYKKEENLNFTEAVLAFLEDLNNVTSNDVVRTDVAQKAGVTAANTPANQRELALVLGGFSTSELQSTLAISALHGVYDYLRVGCITDSDESRASFWKLCAKYMYFTGLTEDYQHGDRVHFNVAIPDTSTGYSVAAGAAAWQDATTQSVPGNNVLGPLVHPTQFGYFSVAGSKRRFGNYSGNIGDSAFLNKFNPVRLFKELHVALGAPEELQLLNFHQLHNIDGAEVLSRTLAAANDLNTLPSSMTFVTETGKVALSDGAQYGFLKTGDDQREDVAHNLQNALGKYTMDIPIDVYNKLPNPAGDIGFATWGGNNHALGFNAQYDYATNAMASSVLPIWKHAENRLSLSDIERAFGEDVVSAILSNERSNYQYTEVDGFKLTPVDVALLIMNEQDFVGSDSAIKFFNKIGDSKRATNVAFHMMIERVGIFGRDQSQIPGFGADSAAADAVLTATDVFQLQNKVRKLQHFFKSDLFNGNEFHAHVLGSAVAAGTGNTTFGQGGHTPGQTNIVENLKDFLLLMLRNSSVGEFDNLVKNSKDLNGYTTAQHLSQENVQAFAVPYLSFDPKTGISQNLSGGSTFAVLPQERLTKLPEL